MHTPDVSWWRFAQRTWPWLLAVLACCGLDARAQTYLYSTYAGSPAQEGFADGPRLDARFRNPTGLAKDAAGNLYVADTGNHVIRRIATDGTVTTLAGSAGQAGSADGTGSAARFSYPWGLAVDASGNVYVGDSGNHTIRRVTPAGVVTTFAGTAGVAGSADGTGAAARFASPSGLTLDAAGNLFVSDYANSTIRRITPGGVVSTFAGTAGVFGYADGVGPAARFNYPDGLVFDTAGNLFVADSNNHILRRITPGGEVTTFTGTPQAAGATDGGPGVARFDSPIGLAFEASGNLLVTDRGNNLLRRVSPDGLVSTIAGQAGVAGSADGSGTVARFDFPTGIVVLGSSEVFLTDTFNDSVRRGLPSALSNTASSGSTAVWLMNGATLSSEATLSLPSDWQIVGAGRFNGDAHIDLIVQNNLTSMRAIWLMNGASIASTVNLGAQHLFWRIAAAGDFNTDGQTDLLWQNRQTGQRVAWLMNGTSLSSVRDLGLHDPNWQINGAANFSGDARPELLVTNTASGDRAIWTLDANLAVTGSVSLGNQHQGWQIVGATDFNGDAQPDIVWQDVFSGLRVIWLMNGTALSSAVMQGVQPRAWQIAAMLDANGDSNPDLVWQNRSIPPLDFDGDRYVDLLVQNRSTGERAVWLMTGTQLRSQEPLPSLASEWDFAGLADFNGDRSPDIILQNLATGQRSIRIMNELTPVSTVELGTQAVSWRIAGAADFNGDSQIDLVWQNVETGQRTIWFMDGPTFNSSMDLGNQPLSWNIVGAADFNGDGQAEIIWQNSATGQTTAWFMNGTALGSAVALGTFGADWRVVAAADVNEDGQTDLIGENVATGQRVVWLMNGFQVGSTIAFGTYPPAWEIAN